MQWCSNGGMGANSPPLFAKLVLGISKTDEKISGRGIVANLQRNRGRGQNLAFMFPYFYSLATPLALWRLD